MNVLKAFRKLRRGSLEKGSDEECFSHTVEETDRLTALMLPSDR